MSKEKPVKLFQEIDDDRNRFSILCYYLFKMIPEYSDNIAKLGLVCEICGELFGSGDSLEEYREAEITNEQANVGV